MARRALAAVAVVGIAAVGLTACSGSKDKAASGSSEGKSLVVTYYKTSSFPQIEDFMKRAKEEFESTHKDVTIDLQPVEADADQYMTKLALMNKSKSKAPDIIYEDTFQVMSDAAAGYLAPIDDYVKNWDEWSQYPESSIQGAKGLDGKIYGVPFGTDTRGIYYNKKIFEQAGLPTDWQPKSWDDLLSAARTIKEKVPDVIPMNIYAGRAGGEQTSMQGFEMLLYGTQDTLYNTDTNKWVTGSQGFKDALTFRKIADPPQPLYGPSYNMFRNPAGIDLGVDGFTKDRPGRVMIAFDNARPEQIEEASYLIRSIIALVDPGSADTLMEQIQVADASQTKAIRVTAGDVKLDKAAINHMKNVASEKESGIPLTVIRISAASDTKVEATIGLDAKEFNPAEMLAFELLGMRKKSADPNNLFAFAEENFK